MQHKFTTGTTADTIRIAEAQLNRKFPQSFFNWLLINNGRSLDGLTVFPVHDPNNLRKTWSSITKNFNEGWAIWINNHSHESLDLSPLFPFAEYGTGDYFCFNYESIGSQGEPEVVLWSHETGKAKFIADNFSAFASNPPTL